MLNSDDLLLVLSLTQEGTLERTAQVLGKDSSSVYRAVKRIEARLGYTLFSRSHRGYKLLPGNTELLHSARIISCELQRINAAVAAGQPVSGELRITTTDFLLQQLMTPAMAEFRRRYPQLELQFDSQNLQTRLWERNFDLAIRPSNQPPEELIGKCLLTTEHQVFAAGCWLENGSLKPGTPWLMPGGEITGHATVRWLQQNISTAVPVIRYDSMLQIQHAVCNGLGAGCLPVLPGAEINCQPIHGYGRFCSTDIWALYHPANRSNSRIKVFLEFFSELLS